MRMLIPAALLTLGVAACNDPVKAPTPTNSPIAGQATPAASTSAATPTASATPPASPTPGNVADRMAAESRAAILREWGKSENRERCAPVMFKDGGGRAATVRRAAFSGGWAIAYDLPGTRSAYGIAGPALTAFDLEPTSQQRGRLARQWPVFREQPNLPRPAFVGYGVEGATDWPATNPDGEGLNSLAYLRIAGQACTYNVWSRLGRQHLEYLLDALVMVDPD